MDVTAYRQTIKVKYLKNPLTLFQLDYSLNIRRWMRTYFPNTNITAHKTLRDAAYAKEKELKQEWWETANKAFAQIFNRPMEIKDYKISGIGRNEFPEGVKKKLRELITEESNYHSIAYAHNLMLPVRMRKFQAT